MRNMKRNYCRFWEIEKCDCEKFGLPVEQHLYTMFDNFQGVSGIIERNFEHLKLFLYSITVDNHVLF